MGRLFDFKRLVVGAAVVLGFSASAFAQACDYCLWNGNGDCWATEDAASEANCKQNAWCFTGANTTTGAGEFCAGGTFTTGKNNTPPTTASPAQGCCWWNTEATKCFTVYTALDVTNCTQNTNTFWAGDACPDSEGACPTGTPTYDGRGSSTGKYCLWDTGDCVPIMAGMSSDNPELTNLEACETFGEGVSTLSDCSDLTVSNTEYWCKWPTGCSKINNPDAESTDNPGMTNLENCQTFGKAFSSQALCEADVSVKKYCDWGTCEGGSGYNCGGGGGCFHIANPDAESTDNPGMTNLEACEEFAPGGVVDQCPCESMSPSAQAEESRCSMGIVSLYSKSATASLRAFHAQGRISVSWNAGTKISNARVSVVNIKGKTVASATVKANGSSIGAGFKTKLPAGTYFVRINARDINGKQIVQQVPVQIVK